MAEIRSRLLCVHPMGGGTMGYRDLAEALGPEQTVWGLRPRGLLAGEEPSRQTLQMQDLFPMIPKTAA